MSEQVTGQVRQTDKVLELATKMTEQVSQTSKVIEMAPEMTEQPGKTGTSVQDIHQPGGFNIGTRGRGPLEKLKKGGVKEAKRMLEDRIRREKREQKLAEVRKPLITTPLRKRTRQEGGE